MRGFLLDTNVISEFDQPKRSSSVIDFVGAQPKALDFVADIVLAELKFGIEMAGSETERSRLTAWVEHFVRPVFGGNVVVTREAEFLEWRLIVAHGRRKKLTYSEPDTLLAATAKSNSLVVVTRDWRPFDLVGVPTIDPWKADYREGNGASPRRIDLKDTSLLSGLGHQ